MVDMQDTREQWRAARRILAIRLDNLGDVLVTTPAIHAIRESVPEAELTLLASPVGAQVGRLNPDIDNVIVYQAPWMDPWHKLPQDSRREQDMVATLREQRFDGAIIFSSFRQSPLPAAYLCYLADIPLRAAASIDGPGSLLTTRHKHPDRMMHEVARGLDLVGAIGFGTTELDLVLQAPEQALSDWRLPVSVGDEEIQGLVESKLRATTRSGPHRYDLDGRVRTVTGSEANIPLVVLHPGCTMPARTYPWEMYAEVADLLVERLGAVVALTGTQEERPLVNQLRARMRPKTRTFALPLAGAMPFPSFCALVQAADLTITNNTGPMHVSAAVKTPVVALFALTNPPEQWGPWRVPHRLLNHDVPCRICYSRICPYEHECLRLVTPSMVVDAAAELLGLETAAGNPISLKGASR